MEIEIETVEVFKCQGLCPKCSSAKVDWGDNGSVGEKYYYDGVCKVCGTSFTEEHDLTYNSTIVDVPVKKE